MEFYSINHLLFCLPKGDKMAKYSNIGKVLFNDIFRENAFNGYVFFYVSKGNEKKAKKMCYVKANDIEKFLNDLDVNSNLNYYYSINTFQNRKGNNEPTNRKNLVLGCNGIVIDIDVKNAKNVIPRDYEDVINKIDILTRKYHIPPYNYIVNSGVGLQIYYLFKPCHKSLAFLVEIAIDILIDFYEMVLKDMPQFTLDKGAIRKSSGSGLFRVPYTYNQKNHKEATIKIWEVYEKKDINDFVNDLSLFSSSKKEKEVANIQVKKEENPNIKRCQKVLCEVQKYQSDVIEMNKKNDGEIHENRNRTCFVYSSFLLHLYSYEKSMELLENFNGNYLVPLSKKRLKYILDYMYKSHYLEEKKKYLYLTNRTILEYLGVENCRYDIIYTPNFTYNDLYAMNKKDRENKRREKKAKQKRVLELLKQKYTYKEISNMVDVSVSTISRIAKKENGNKEKVKDIKPWERMGISRATYYRRRK